MTNRDRPELLVFLGNTGARYARTRHNVAWLLEDELGGGGAWQQKFKGVWRKATIEGEQVVVLKPQTMMNLSGEAVQAAARFFKYDVAAVAVAHDDVVRHPVGLGACDALAD